MSGVRQGRADIGDQSEPSFPCVGIVDTDERRAIFGRAADLFAEGASVADDRKRILIETPVGPLSGWFFPAVAEGRCAAIVIGGVEGWAMDFAEMATSFAARGVEPHPR
jgi:hypothetical protein